jgi:hypothetical protein
MAIGTGYGERTRENEAVLPEVIERITASKGVDLSG